MDCAVTLPLDALVNLVVNFFTGQPVWKFEENLEALKISRDELKATMDGVTWKVKREKGYEKEVLPNVNNWLNTVEVMLCEVDKLVASIDKEGDRSCVCLFFSTKVKFADKVYRSLQRVTEECKKGDFKEVVGKPPPKAGAERNVEPTVGTDDMLDDAWNFILEEESGTLGIYGMGGVGKTTLLKQINNRLLDNPGDFEVIIFVTVSKDSREEKIQDEICSSLGLSSADINGKRVQAIFNELSKKKFVLLLDDLWGPIELADDIGVPKKGKRSKVVLTARGGDVCAKMGATKLIKVEPLAWNFAWPLFKSKVGEDTLFSHPDIISLAEEVARECAGLPIALITIGWAMALKKNPEEWTSALEDLRKRSADSQSEDFIKKVYDRLKFSYDNLHDEAKACFLYCSLFPEDFKILKRSLIDYWRCEEFVSTDNVGYDIIGNLSRASLLEEERDYVKMHDVIRDMALWIAGGGEKYFVLTGDQRFTEVHEVADWEDKTKISLMSNNIKEITGNPNCHDLVTLFLCGNVELEEISGSFFKNMNALKVLDLSDTAITKLPVDVSKLILLQYLNLSNTDIQELPIHLRDLVILKFLNLEDTVFLGMIPKGLIPSFQHLRVLKMYKCGSSCKEVGKDSIWSSGDLFEEELQSLKHLEDLTTTIRDTSILQSSSRIRSLFKSFQAIVLEHVTGSKSLNIWSLESMENLQNLVCNSDDLDVHADKSNPEEVEPLVRAGRRRHKLEILEAPQRFKSLRDVTVENCHKLVDLTWVVLLPKLAILKVEVCENIKEIISDQKLSELSVEGETFQRLEILVLYGLPELYSIYSKRLPLPNLTTVSIRQCPKLEKLPLDSARAGKCSINADKAFGYENDETG